MARWIALAITLAGCPSEPSAPPAPHADQRAPRPAARPAEAPSPTPPAPPSLQAEAARLRLPLPDAPRLAPLGPLTDPAPVTLQFASGGATWTARLQRCVVPSTSEFASQPDRAVADCAQLELLAAVTKRYLVVGDDTPLGRPSLRVVPGAAGRAGLAIAADLYDRRHRWPRRALLIEADADDQPRLAWRGDVGTCAFEPAEDPEEARAPATCDPADEELAYRDVDQDGDLDLVVTGYADGVRSTRTFLRARSSVLEQP